SCGPVIPHSCPGQRASVTPGGAGITVTWARWDVGPAGWPVRAAAARWRRHLLAARWRGHAQASPLWAALHAGAGRAARPGRAGRRRLPPERSLGPGWPARGGGLLHAERLPHHRSVTESVGDHRPDAAGRFLAPPRAAAAARPVRHADGGRRLGHAAGPA